MVETGAGVEEEVMVFDRTPVGRIVSCVAVLASAAFLFDYLSRGRDDIRPLPLAGLILLLAGTLFSALLQYGDRIYVGAEGVMYRNRFFQRLRTARWMRWDDVIEVREIRKKMLVLLSADGRRVLVDAIAGYAIARSEILRRAPRAIRSGTLVQGERS